MTTDGFTVDDGRLTAYINRLSLINILKLNIKKDDMLHFTQRTFLYNFLIWSVVAVFTATQLYLKALPTEDHQGWWAFFKIQLLVWWIWGIITPLIFWLANQFRIDRSTFWKGILIHLPISGVIVLAYLATYAAVWTWNTHGTVAIDTFQFIFQILFLNLFHWHLFIYMAIIGVVHARLYYIESKNRELQQERLENQLLVSQLNFLKMQLQPHFLFNTLNGIVSSIHQNKPIIAANMTTELSELLRLSLAGAEQPMVSLAQELQHVKTYLNIEKYRFKDLQVQYEIPNHLLNLEVPNFLLQPIVENAIKHGISKKATAHLICLSVRQRGQYLYFSIYNEGPVLSNEIMGTGLTNIKKQLQVLYGESGKLSIKSFKNGVVVEISIPV